MTEQTIALLRYQIAALLSQVDTAEKPRPNSINHSPDPNPGAVWQPAKGWTVRTVDDGVTDARFVYVTCPEHARSGCCSDFDAVTTVEARRLAMALLAAADRADGLADGVTPLDARRPDNPSKEIS
ncbi:hypothetical protein [Actinomadura luteofluorescens]|uniref:hypothetical protein n=1 Tax=Actinomadura luteofluorescens TaxID=46163 RepID=UPI003D932B1F